LSQYCPLLPGRQISEPAEELATSCRAPFPMDAAEKFETHDKCLQPLALLKILINTLHGRCPEE